MRDIISLIFDWPLSDFSPYQWLGVFKQQPLNIEDMKSEQRCGMHNGIQRMLLDENASWNSHDVDKITIFYTEDCIKEDVAVETSTRGKKEMKVLLHRVFSAFPDLNVKLTSCFHSDEWAASEWIMSGTYSHQFPGLPPPTGRDFSVRGSTIMKLQNGKISRVSDYWNFLSFLRQLGLLPKDS